MCDGYDDVGRLLAHPLGGGFELAVPVHDVGRFRLVVEGERSAALLRKGKFGLADGEEAFEGWSNGHLWNGWEMPRFKFSVCESILRFLGGERGRFDAGTDAFVTVGNDEEERWTAEEITLTDGSRLKAYPLGVGSWIWEER